MNQMVRNMTGVVNCYVVSTFYFFVLGCSGKMYVKRLAEFEGFRRRNVCLLE